MVVGQLSWSGWEWLLTQISIERPEADGHGQVTKSLDNDQHLLIPTPGVMAQNLRGAEQVQ